MYLTFNDNVLTNFLVLTASCDSSVNKNKTKSIKIKRMRAANNKKSLSFSFFFSMEEMLRPCRVHLSIFGKRKPEANTKRCGKYISRISGKFMNSQNASRLKFVQYFLHALRSLSSYYFCIVVMQKFLSWQY